MEDITREWVKENETDCCGARCSEAGCCIGDKYEKAKEEDDRTKG